jgi:TorA maturation chaperone TorD
LKRNHPASLEQWLVRFLVVWSFPFWTVVRYRSHLLFYKMSKILTKVIHMTYMLYQDMYVCMYTFASMTLYYGTILLLFTNLCT